MEKHDNFLADSIKVRPPRLSYMDGFRFGCGFFIAGLLISLLLGGLTWGLVVVLGLR